jgi:hypothetical protein
VVTAVDTSIEVVTNKVNNAKDIISDKLPNIPNPLSEGLGWWHVSRFFLGLTGIGIIVLVVRKCTRWYKVVPESSYKMRKMTFDFLKVITSIAGVAAILSSEEFHQIFMNVIHLYRFMAGYDKRENPLRREKARYGLGASIYGKMSKSSDEERIEMYSVDGISRLKAANEQAEQNGVELSPEHKAAILTGEDCIEPNLNLDFLTYSDEDLGTKDIPEGYLLGDSQDEADDALTLLARFCELWESIKSRVRASTTIERYLAACLVILCLIPSMLLLRNYFMARNQCWLRDTYAVNSKTYAMFVYSGLIVLTPAEQRVFYEQGWSLLPGCDYNDRKTAYAPPPQTSVSGKQKVLRKNLDWEIIEAKRLVKESEKAFTEFVAPKSPRKKHLYELSKLDQMVQRELDDPCYTKDREVKTRGRRGRRIFTAREDYLKYIAMWKDDPERAQVFYDEFYDDWLDRVDYIRGLEIPDDEKVDMAFMTEIEMDKFMDDEYWESLRLQTLSPLMPESKAKHKPITLEQHADLERRIVTVETTKGTEAVTSVAFCLSIPFVIKENGKTRTEYFVLGVTTAHCHLDSSLAVYIAGVDDPAIIPKGSYWKSVDKDILLFDFATLSSAGVKKFPFMKKRVFKEGAIRLIGPGGKYSSGTCSGRVNHDIDTEKGFSGSPVFTDPNNTVIGVHAYGKSGTGGDLYPNSFIPIATVLEFAATIKPQRLFG